MIRILRRATLGTWMQLIAAILLTACVAMARHKDDYRVADIPLFITLAASGVLLSLFAIAVDVRRQKPSLLVVLLIVYNALAVMYLPLVIDISA